MPDDKPTEGPSRSRREVEEENANLRAELDALRTKVAEDQGPPVGTEVCYQRAGEGFCRPARVASDGFTELLKHPTGIPQRHALIEYGEAPWSGGASELKDHTFQVDRPWDPLGKPETWHVPSHCPRDGQAGCPYAKDAHWPPKPPRLDSVEAP